MKVLKKGGLALMHDQVRSKYQKQRYGLGDLKGTSLYRVWSTKYKFPLLFLKTRLLITKPRNKESFSIERFLESWDFSDFV